MRPERTVPLPDTADLLVAGGDARIAPDPLSGRNKYGCQATPAPGLAAFGSSTSSVISPGAFAAADALRHRLARDLADQPPALLYRREMDRLRRELLQLLGLESRGTGLVFSASGTDVHLLAARIAAMAASGRPLVIMAGEAESGSGVPMALAGRHFSSYSAMGCATAPGQPIDEEAGADFVSVTIRHADGSLRDAAQVDAEVECLAAEAAARGRSVLLVLMDVSKTGCIAPSVSCALELHRRWNPLVKVLVDACQFRLEAATVRAYVDKGLMVALTGSKFVTGPSFSGALLLPLSICTPLRNGEAPRVLRCYSSREEWPQDWRYSLALESRENFGLLMRWQAAVHELREFCLVPAPQVAGVLRRFGQAVQQRLRSDPHFSALDVPVLERSPLGSASCWDGIQTIHGFLLYRRCRQRGRVRLSRSEVAAIHRQLQMAGMPDAIAYQLGQPVDCSVSVGEDVSALRLCMSARLAVQAAHSPGEEARILARAMACLDEIVRLVGPGVSGVGDAMPCRHVSSPLATMSKEMA